MIYISSALKWPFTQQQETVQDDIYFVIVPANRLFYRQWLNRLQNKMFKYVLNHLRNKLIVWYFQIKNISARCAMNVRKKTVSKV